MATLAAFRKRTGLDAPTVLKMLKAGLPPTIVVAIYQSDAISNITTTVGYITALMTITAQCLLPRAKYTKIMFFILLSVCVAASLCCLAAFCSIKARGTGPGSQGVYNSNASAVSAIFLIVCIWLSNSLRAYRPMELQDPMVAFSIFSAISLTHTGQFTTVPEGLQFIKRLLCAFMLAFAIATGVSLFILPITNRRNIFQGLRTYPATVQGVLNAFNEYVESLRNRDIDEAGGNATSSDATDKPSDDIQTSAATVNVAMQRLQGLHTMMGAELIYAKSEIAWGTLTPVDLQTIFTHLRGILLPMAGLKMSTELLEKLACGKPLFPKESDTTEKKAPDPDSGSQEQEIRARRVDRYLESLRQDTSVAIGLVTAGLEHSFMNLGILKENGLLAHSRTSQENNDIEAGIDTISPGCENFSDQFKIRRYEFHKRHHDPVGPLHTIMTSYSGYIDWPRPAGEEDIGRRFASEELLVAISLENIHDELLDAVDGLMTFTEQRLASGALRRNHLIVPEDFNILKWFSLDLLRPKKEPGSVDEVQDDSDSQSDVDDANNDSSIRQTDPEHLSPNNTWEWFGDQLRALSSMMSSDQSVFGFRVACASFTVGILAYLHQTQDFYLEQRLIWAMIVIVIGMSPSSGASIFGFIGRVLSTIVALVLSFIIYYIVDGRTAGVIVFLFIANCFEYYFYLKYPQIFGPVVISIVTMNVIVAYELQVKKLGIPRAESSGQPYYPIYLFGPYKLACVAAGCLISFFWTIFPYPISTRLQVRKMLGRSIFTLANIYGYMHTTVETWMMEGYSDAQSSASLMLALDNARTKLFARQMALLAGIRKNVDLTKYEPAFGGKFPKSVYNQMIGEIQAITFGMSIMAYLTRDFQPKIHPPSEEDESKPSEWIDRMAHLAMSTEFNTHRTTLLLCQLAAAVSNGTAVPPYLAPLEPFPLARSLQRLNEDIMDITNADDPAFRAFASMEVMSSLVNEELRSLSRNVITLVGEMNFKVK
ncbi:hypothetical protein AAFC00_001990 [Neodothiora populina]